MRQSWDILLRGKKCKNLFFFSWSFKFVHKSLFPIMTDICLPLSTKHSCIIIRKVEEKGCNIRLRYYKPNSYFLSVYFLQLFRLFPWRFYHPELERRTPQMEHGTPPHSFLFLQTYLCWNREYLDNFYQDSGLWTLGGYPMKCFHHKLSIIDNIIAFIVFERSDTQAESCQSFRCISKTRCWMLKVIALR